MTAGSAASGRVPSERDSVVRGVATGVLADRIAAALVHREPGWRLPRRSSLARRYNVSIPEVDGAIGELIRRSLVRRLPDGQLYRASQAEYLIPVEGIGGLRPRPDPMGGDITCQSRPVSQRDAPQDNPRALGGGGQPPPGLPPGGGAGGGPVGISSPHIPGA